MNLDNISVNSQDANTPKLDSLEEIIVRDTCDEIITWPNFHWVELAEPAVSAELLATKRSRHRSVRCGSRFVRIATASPQDTYSTWDVATLWDALSKNRENCAMNWADRRSLKWRLNNSVHPHGHCRFSETSMLLSITGVQPRKLRVKDWQNAHGKVGIIGCQFQLRSQERT